MNTRAAAGLSESEVSSTGEPSGGGGLRRRRVGGCRRRGQQVEQRLQADEVSRRAGRDREEPRPPDRRRERLLQLGGADLFSLEVLLDESVVCLGDGLGELVAQLGGAIGELGRDLPL